MFGSARVSGGPRIPATRCSCLRQEVALQVFHGVRRHLASTCPADWTSRGWALHHLDATLVWSAQLLFQELALGKNETLSSNCCCRIAQNSSKVARITLAPAHSLRYCCICLSMNHLRRQAAITFALASWRSVPSIDPTAFVRNQCHLANMSDTMGVLSP